MITPAQASGSDMPSRTEFEQRFRTWAQGPSDSETARGENAKRIITDCMRDAGILDKYQLDIFPQGSFPNRTNIPQESDVDVAVRCMRSAYLDLPAGTKQEDYGFSDGTLRYVDLKNDVGKALSACFGAEASRGKKCFTIRSNSYRLDADVTPSFEHRRYYDTSDKRRYYSGCQFFSDSGEKIINWPRQHIENGINKNDATKRRFKRLTRILKRLQFALIELGTLKEKIIPSYAVECAVFNVPDDHFRDESYWNSVQRVLALIFNSTVTDDRCADWVEVNGMKWMFRGSKPWTRQQVHQFVSLGWNHIGYQ